MGGVSSHATTAALDLGREKGQAEPSVGAARALPSGVCAARSQQVCALSLGSTSSSDALSCLRACVQLHGRGAIHWLPVTAVPP